MPAKLTIYVEGSVDKVIVGHLLNAANLTRNVSITVCSGKASIARVISQLEDSDDEKSIALVDADELSVADSRSLAMAQLGHPAIPVFCAVPNVEAWLFADDALAIDVARNEQAARTLERTPLPESIPYPKQLASYVFPKEAGVYGYSFLARVDISKAAARSPSLRAFLVGVAEALGEYVEFASQSFGRSVSRDAFSTLLRELPSDTVAWRTMDGTEIHADELARAIAEGTEIGMQYVTEVLRISRDLVARRSRQ